MCGTSELHMKHVGYAFGMQSLLTCNEAFTNQGGSGNLRSLVVACAWSRALDVLRSMSWLGSSGLCAPKSQHYSVGMKHRVDPKSLTNFPVTVVGELLSSAFTACTSIVTPTTRGRQVRCYTFSYCPHRH